MADRSSNVGGRLERVLLKDPASGLIYHGDRGHSSSPPKHAVEKKEYVKSKGGHEASGTGDENDKGRKDKKDHGGGSGGGGGGGGGGGRRRGKDSEDEKIYCPNCEDFFSFKEFVKHDCKKLQSSTGH